MFDTDLPDQIKACWTSKPVISPNRWILYWLRLISEYKAKCTPCQLLFSWGDKQLILFWVFGRGLYESRSPIYICARAEGRLWGGLFVRTIYLIWSFFWRSSESGKCFGAIEPIFWESCARLKADRPATFGRKIRHIPAHTGVCECRTNPTHRSERWEI